MRTKLVLLGALSLLLSTAGARATTSTVAYDDPDSPVVEPILTRSSLVEIDANRPCPRIGIGLPTSSNGENCSLNPTDNGSADITHLDVTVGNGAITAHVGVKQPFITDATQLPGIAPYSGQHVLLVFQSKLFETNQVIGGANVHPATWGPPGYNADNFHWFLYYGWTLSENRTVCGMGYYDPTGELIPPGPVVFGQTFFMVGQNNSTYVYKLNTQCPLSADGKTVTFVQPYTYRWQDATGTIPLQVKILDLTNPTSLGCKAGTSHQRCDSIWNVSAFSWLDHEAGAPDPAGNPGLDKATWYTDSLPKSAYNLGLIAGDPNPSMIVGPRCYLDALGLGEPNEHGSCIFPNPVGPGFKPVGPEIVATS